MVEIDPKRTRLQEAVAAASLVDKSAECRYVYCSITIVYEINCICWMEILAVIT
jgi:hypothetical protein